ncbi:hypothetical protein D5086_014590 [Populus alba]|uniref:Uncharacterized protein n=1 Tax=Populus alba TaxID=43335 RepID=A0ACC4BXW9_POPAL
MRIAEEAITNIYSSTFPTSLAIADLGCSSGPNTLYAVSELVKVVDEVRRKLGHQSPEYQVLLNDLPGNDFNAIFKSLAGFQENLKKQMGDGFGPCFFAGVPGSFYCRLFRAKSLHFVHSSYSLMWLSRVPPSLYDKQGKPINKGSVHISESSPPLVSQAYYAQFQEDFSLFLRSRSEELANGGRMVLIMLGRIGPDHVDRGNSFYWELLSRSLSILATQGEIEKEDIDSYDVHFYAPTKDEMEAEIRREGSFELERLEMFETEKELYKVSDNYGTEVAMTVRAIQESMLSHHFGEGILDALFDIYGRMVEEEMLKEEINPITFVVVLRKL